MFKLPRGSRLTPSGSIAINRELDAKGQLVALARKKAQRSGTTLEAKVEDWLTAYVTEPEEDNARRASLASPSYGPAPAAIISRAVKNVNRAGSADRASNDTRSAAYRRLLGVMSDSSKRTS